MENYTIDNFTDGYERYYADRHRCENPNYKTRVEQGIPLPFLPYVLNKDKAAVGTWSEKTDTYYYGSFYSSSTSAGGPFYLNDATTGYKGAKALLDSKLADLWDHESNKLLGKIKSQSLPLLMLYKERHETGELILGFLQKASDFALYARRRQWKRALNVYGFMKTDNGTSRYILRHKAMRKHALAVEQSYSASTVSKWIRRAKRSYGKPGLFDTVGNAWLQARFAWSTLYMDIEDCLAANSKFENKLHAFHQRVGTKFEFDVTHYEHYAPWRGHRGGWLGMYITYYVSDPTLSALGSIMDVPTFLWDAVPWSFVIDRVVDISTYLDLRNATIGATFSGGCSTTFYKDLISGPRDGDVINYWPNRAFYLGWPYGRKITMVGNYPTRADVRMIRTVLTSFPTPKLEFPMKNSLILGTDLVFLGRQVSRKFAARLT